MESAGKRRHSGRDESLISAFTALRDSSIIQTGPKRPREGLWHFTPDPPSLKRAKRRSASSRKASEPSSLLKSTRSRKQSSDVSVENTPHTELVQTVRELINAATEMDELIPGTAASQRYQLTPTPVSSRSTTRQTRSSSRKSKEYSTPIPETPSTHTKSSNSVLQNLSATTVTKPTPNTSRASFEQSATVTQHSPSPPGEPSQSQPPSAAPFLSTLPDDATLEPLGGEGDNVSQEDDEDIADEMEADGSGNNPTNSAQPADVGSPTNVSSQHLEPTKKRKRAPPVKRKPSKTLPRSLIKNLFMLSSKRRLTKDAMDLVMKFSELYLKQASHDLAVYAGHAGRKTVDVNDAVLLLHRQRAITERKSFEYLVNTHLPLEYIQELLPCALTGKAVVPHAT